MSKLIGISRSKYRMAVSDILPYERPIFFTNRFFTRFLKYHGIVCCDGKLVATKNWTEGLEQILSILGGMGAKRRPAFQYSIAKSTNENGRLLTVIHPYHQVQMIEFYDHFKTVIIDFCQRSSYSIRYPYKVAVFQKKPKGFPQYISDDNEKTHPEESIKHFFAYKHYHNINDFFDDYRFLRAEKTFSLMEKTDLEHCFDSIKPELLSVAMFGCSMDKAEGSMPYVFYKLNQSFENHPDLGNPGEGIVIGPEFSRIYAEIIMQRIDTDCEAALEKEGIVLNRDYVFYRYVDDGYLFCNTEKVKNVFNDTYELYLSKYGLKRGVEKKVTYLKRPFLDNLTSGKLALLKLIDQQFENRLETFKGFKKMQLGHYDTPTALDYKSFVQSVRAIVHTYDLSYDKVMSYILGLINNHLSVLLKDFNDLYKQYSQAEYYGEISEQGLAIKRQYERDFSEFLNNLVEVLFYFFCCDSRMSTSTKVISIINQLQLFVRGKYRFENGDLSAKFTQSVIDELDQVITGQTQSLFFETSSQSVCHIETLNFLELQKRMSVSVQIHPNQVIEFATRMKDKLNFFSVFQLLHFVKNDSRYVKLKQRLLIWAKNRISILYDNPEVSCTESVLTFMEAIFCPWVERAWKEEVINEFKQFEENDKKAVLTCAAKQKELFVKWHDYSILEEMQHISNTEVY